MKDIPEQIRAAYKEELAANKTPVTEQDIPLSYEAITSEWLTNVLCKSTAGAKVESFELGAPDNGSSNRRKISIRYNAAGTDAGLPEKVFCKATQDLANRMVLGISGGLHGEVTYYNHVRPLLDIESPFAYFANYSPRSFNSIIILNDISDEVESFCDHNTPMNKRRLESQMELLATMHSRFLNSPELTTVLASLGTWPQFLKRTEAFGMEAGSNKGFRDAEEVIPARLYKRYDEVWPKTIASAEKHDQLPQTFIHNDVHLKNWYCMPNDVMGLSDWQCATTGHWSRDLAYTIATACTIEERRNWEKDLIAYYLEKMAEGGATGISFDETWNHYRQQMLSVLTWWTITLAPTDVIPDMQPRDITLQFIKRIATAMDDLDTMDVE
ncbi:MAG: phosphotransferase [Tissierellales bacterium]